MVVNITLDDEFIRSQKLQRRWRKLQSLAADVYHSDLTDIQIADLITKVRGRIDGYLGNNEPPDLSEEVVINRD